MFIIKEGFVRVLRVFFVNVEDLMNYIKNVVFKVCGIYWIWVLVEYEDIIFIS